MLEEMGEREPYAHVEHLSGPERVDMGSHDPTVLRRPVGFLARLTDVEPLVWEGGLRMSAAKVVMVHPDDVNLADVKALPAKHDASVVGNPYCPRGKAFVMDDPRVEWPEPDPEEDA